MTLVDAREANRQAAIARRIAAADQREELIGKPVSAVVSALVHPTEDLASLRLSKLFNPRGRDAGPIPGVGVATLNRVFIQLIEDHPRGRQWWHAELKLRDLTEQERRRLIRALVQHARQDWREAT